MTRHEFLAALHDILRPGTYLEIGVQYGTSYALAQGSSVAIGIDPNPLLDFMPQNIRPNQNTYLMTSDDFFRDLEKEPWTIPPVNLAFIDGMHLYENALRDFSNVERHMAPGGIVVFDDVLPYNQAIAEREQPPGDWTGDVWKVYPILRILRPDLVIFLVDTAPTGTMIVVNPNPDYEWPRDVNWGWPDGDEVPKYILERTDAKDPNAILEWLRVMETS